MSLLIPNHEQSEANWEERVSLIRSIMEIQDTESLHNLVVMAKVFKRNEIKSHPLGLDDFIHMLDVPMVERLWNLFKEESPKYIANSQVQELLKKELDNYRAFEEEIA